MSDTGGCASFRKRDHGIDGMTGDDTSGRMPAAKLRTFEFAQANKKRARSANSSADGGQDMP
jgi:hypothetical protein